MKGSWHAKYNTVSLHHIDPRSAGHVWCQHPDLPGDDGGPGGGDGVGPHLRPADSHGAMCLGRVLCPAGRSPRGSSLLSLPGCQPASSEGQSPPQPVQASLPLARSLRCSQQSHSTHRWVQYIL